MKCRKRIRRCQNRGVTLPAGQARPSGIRRVGSAKLDQAPVRNVENLAGDDKGKGASGPNREAENTDAPERGGLPRSSDEAAVMVVERRGQVIAVGLGQPAMGGTRHSTEGGSLQSMARAG